MAGQLLLWVLYPNSFGAVRCRRPANWERATVATPSLIDRISSCPAKSYHAKRLSQSGFVQIAFALPNSRPRPFKGSSKGQDTGHKAAAVLRSERPITVGNKPCHAPGRRKTHSPPPSRSGSDSSVQCVACLPSLIHCSGMPRASTIAARLDAADFALG